MEKQMQEISLKKSVLWNSVGTIFYLACQWLITILVVKLSNVETAGVLALAMTISNSFATIALFGIRQFQVSDYEEKYSDKVYITSRYITCGIAMIGCVIYTSIQNVGWEQWLCAILYMVYRVAESFVDVYHGIDQKHWRLDIVGKSFILRGILMLAGFCATLAVTGSLIFSIGVMAVTSFGVVMAYDIVQANKLQKEKGSFDFESLKQLFIECVPLVVFNFLFSFIALIPRTMLESSYGAERLGIYSSIASPTLIVQVFASVVFNPFLPIIAQYYNKNNRKEYYALMNKMLSVLIVVTVVALLAGNYLGEWGLSVLYRGQDGILENAYLLVPIIWCTVLTAGVWIYSAILIAIRKILYLIIDIIIAITVCFACSGYFIENYNMNGVSFTVILSEAILLGLMIVQVYLANNKSRKGEERQI